MTTPLASQLRTHELITVRLLARGCGTAEIARQLGVKPATVRSIVRAIGDKWGTNDRAQIVTVARGLGIVPDRTNTQE